MPASRQGEVQTDKNDGRKFITLRVGSNGYAAYRKVYLRTKDRDIARRRAAVLDGITDPEQARSIVAYLAKSPTPEIERQRALQLTTKTPLVPVLSLTDAHKELTTLLSDFDLDPPDALTVQHWQAASSLDELRSILVSLGIPRDWLDDNPDIWLTLAPTPRQQKINVHYGNQREALARLLRMDPDKLPPDRPARGPKLSACIGEFRKDQEQRQVSHKNTNAYVSKFQAFVDLLHDKPIRALTKPDFVRFTDHVRKEKKGKSNKTLNDHLQAAKAVLSVARTRMDDGIFPDGLNHWLSVADAARRPYKAKLSNREPMPADVFRSLLGKADEWAECDPVAVAAALPQATVSQYRGLSDRRNSTTGTRQKRDGLLGHIGLCLAANVGATAIDLVRLLWSELSLDGKLPLFTQSRSRTETNEDMIIPVRCPLLPETIRSLKRWKAYQDAERPCDHVFVNDKGETFDPDDSTPITDIFGRLRKAVDCCGRWQARHLRNVGATLQRDHGLDEAVATAWLRHSGDSKHGTNSNVSYRGVAKDDYLLPLVQVIGREYWGLKTL